MEKLSKSLEKYLCVIFELSKENKKITPKDVSKLTGYNAPSTLEGIKALQKKGCVDYFPYKGVKITEKGYEYYKNMISKKEIVSLFLEKFLLIEKEDMDKVSDDFIYSTNDFMLDRFNSFLDFLNFCPCGAPRWIEGFKSYLEHGEMTEKCAKCIEICLEGGKKPDCIGCKI